MTNTTPSSRRHLPLLEVFVFVPVEVEEVPRTMEMGTPRSPNCVNGYGQEHRPMRRSGASGEEPEYPRWLRRALYKWVVKAKSPAAFTTQMERLGTRLLRIVVGLLLGPFGFGFSVHIRVHFVNGLTQAIPTHHLLL